MNYLHFVGKDGLKINQDVVHLLDVVRELSAIYTELQFYDRKTKHSALRRRKTAITHRVKFQSVMQFIKVSERLNTATYATIMI